MANGGALGIGIFFLLIGGAGFLTPNSVWNENSRGTQFADMTIPQVYELCSSGLGQLGQMFSGDIQKACSEYRTVTYAIYGSGLIGLILIIVGAVVSGKKEDVSHLEVRYAKGELSKGELESKKEKVNEETRPRKTQSPQEKLREDNLKNLGILKQRLAKGEISKQEYDELKQEFEN